MNTTSLVPFFLGTFSGFLATLPVGPAKIVAVRKFLLFTKGNENEVSNINSSNIILLSSICGLIFAQLLFFLALQFPFLYSLWVKPHLFGLFFVSILFVYLYKLKDLQLNVYNTQPLLRSDLNFSYQQAAFLETLLLQLLNPVVLPNPIFCRLNNLFLFRYSTLFSFFAGNFLGLLSGYGTFYISTLFLLKKLELDAPTIYRLVKIKIHKFFGIIFVIFSFICLSRTPLPAIQPFQLKTPSNKFSFNTFDNMWPDSFFGYERWKRPLRLVAFDNIKSQPNDEIKPFNKMFFSQFFFEGCLKDGKYHLYHNFPQNLSIVSKTINSLFPTNSPKDFFEEDQNTKLLENWVKEKRNRQNKINQIIDIKINQIEKGFILEEIAEKKTSSLDLNKNKISKQMDPRLSIDTRGTKNFLKNKSFLFLTKEYFSKKDSLTAIEERKFTNIYTKNKLKLFLADNYPNLPQSKGEKIPFITWKPFIQSSSEKSNNLKERSLQNLNLVEKTSDSTGLKTTAWQDLFKRFSITLSNGFQRGQKLLTFENEEDSGKNLRQEESLESIQEENNVKITKIYKPMPLWNPNFNKKELDSIKRQSTNKLHIKIFFPKSNHLADRQNFVPPLKPFFRRNEFPGTITSRRGKAVCWNLFQKKPIAPLFVNHLNQLKNFFDRRKKRKINQDVPTRSWQPTSRLFQFLRDYLLSLQAYIRKYIKLPLLISLKNLVRQFFFQPAEWEKDWTNLSKEVYIECDFYGKAVSIGVKLPNFFANDEPKQIKIINPFQLRFWTRSLSQTPAFQELENYSFLNVWGRETKMPFGKVKKSPSFWQLLVERIKLLLQYKILKKLSVPINTMNVQNQLDHDKVQSNNEAPSILVPIEVIEKNQKLRIEKTKNELPHGSFTKLQRNSSEKNLKDRSTKRKKINNSAQIKNLSLINNKTTRIRRYTLKSVIILFQKQWFNFYRFFLKKEREIVFSLNTNSFKFKKLVLQTKNQLLKLFTKFFYKISRLFSFLCSRVSKILKFLLLKFTNIKQEHSSNLESFSLNPTNNLSQAYIIHNIWEERIMSRPNITALMKNWNGKDPLKKELEDFLNKQGILGNDKPQNLTKHQWKEWLKKFQAFTPSLKLWALWAPNYWTRAVENYWKEVPSSRIETIINQETNKIDISYKSELKKGILPRTKFLEYFIPLFQATQKQNKLWKFNLLSRNYTEINNDGDVDSFLSWETNDFDKKTQFLFDTLKKIKGKDKNLLVRPTVLSSLPQLRENRSKRFDIQQDIRKELPLIQREKKRLDFDIKLQTLRQRGSFFPVSIRRWKLKKLKNKLEKLAKTVIKKPQGGELTSYFAIGEKNKKMIRELFQSETRLFANILENWNAKVLDDEFLLYNTVSSVLRFGNKNNNASLLAYGAHTDNSSDSSALFPLGVGNNFDLYFVLLEDIYLPTHLREIKILDCFTTENQNRQEILRLSQSNKNSHKQSFTRNKNSVYTDTIRKWRLMLQQNQNTPSEALWAIKDRQKIVRFLWPTHRLEDLSCINRCWMATANQSRFSMLRIHNFPNV